MIGATNTLLCVCNTFSVYWGLRRYCHWCLSSYSPLYESLCSHLWLIGDPTRLRYGTFAAFCGFGFYFGFYFCFGLRSVPWAQVLVHEDEEPWKFLMKLITQMYRVLCWILQQHKFIHSFWWLHKFTNRIETTD